MWLFSDKVDSTRFGAFYLLTISQQNDHLIGFEFSIPYGGDGGEDCTLLLLFLLQLPSPDLGESQSWAGDRADGGKEGWRLLDHAQGWDRGQDLV